MKIKTVISDLGNVLVFVNHLCAGLDLSGHNFFDKCLIHSKIKKYETGKISTEEFYTWFGKKTKQGIDLNNLDNRFDSIFSLNEDMALLLERLKKDYRLIALSNTNEANYNFISKKYSVFSLFDDYVLSYKAGYLKPDKRIYKIALEKALCRPEECVFIDDIKKFVDVAKSVGMNAVQYKSHAYLEEKLKELGLL